jgi:hypothetical protein
MRRSAVPVSARTLLLFPLAFASSLGAGVAHAQVCNRPDLVDTLPQDGATGIPLNARLVARYERSAEYLGESVLFGRAGEEPVALPAFFSPSEGLLEVTPPDALEPGTTYDVEWPALRGIATASLGRGARIRFTAGDREDTEPPRFSGVEHVTWRLERRRDPCTDRRDERFVFDLELGEPRDDGGRDALALVVFQTAGPGFGASSGAAPVLTQAMPAGRQATVRLPIEDAVGSVCFAAIVRDLAGQISASGNVEACTETEAPPFFQGCAIGRARRDRSRAGGASLLLAVAAVYARRRRAPGARPEA